MILSGGRQDHRPKSRRFFLPIKTLWLKPPVCFNLCSGRGGERDAVHSVAQRGQLAWVEVRLV
jgi:hypothetical protein